jgi:hypothetical protein
MYRATSEEGAVRFQDCSEIIGAAPFGWMHRREWSGGYPRSDVANGPLFRKLFRGFGLQSRTSYRDTVQIPHWFFVFVGLLTAIGPWVPWSLHFSLRTLLIIMTIAAITLGAIVWAVK